MSGKKSKAIKKKVRALFESGKQPENDAQNAVLTAAVNAQPMTKYQKADDQTGVPAGKIRVQAKVVAPENPLRVAQRAALRKLSGTEQSTL